MSIESSVQYAYDQVASQFGDSRRHLHWPELDQEIEKVTQLIQNTSDYSVLDIGCGTGRLCHQLSDLSINYTGTDISLNQLKIAQKACSNNQKNQFIQGDMTSLPFKDNSFDHVFMIASLHHISNKEGRLKALSEAVRVAKPGAWIFITNMNLYKKRYFKLFLSKKQGLQTLSHQDQKQIKWNDVFIPWSWKSEKTVYRYYHAFTKPELTELFKDIPCDIISHEFIKRGKKVKFWEANNIVSILKKSV